MRHRRYLAAVAAAVVGTVGAVTAAHADNPIVTDIYTADPAALVHDGRLYIYTGRDEASPTQQNFVMREWRLFSSDAPASEPEAWTDHGSPLSLEDFDWGQANAWASEVEVGPDGRFYWYVSIDGNTDDGWMNIGVAVGDSPTGPFEDAIGGPLISDEMPNSSALNIDPTVFVDDDGQIYMYWGSFWQPRMVRLKPNMVELDSEIITPQGIPNFWEAPWMFKRGDTYYLAFASNFNDNGDGCVTSQNFACVRYATADSPLGPWTERGIVLDQVSSTTNHPAIIEFPEGSDEWWMVYHTADAPGGGNFRRSVAIDRLFFNEDGTMQKVVQTPIPDIDPGTPTYTGSDDPVPDEPAAFDPSENMLQAIYDADAAAGGESYWIDRILGRPAGGGAGGDLLYTKGRALYMYTHDEDDLGFGGGGTGANQGGGGAAYREAISGGSNNHLYTVEISDADLEEDPEQRLNSPSHWSSVHTGDGLSVAQDKFITHNNVAVTILNITNTGDEPTTRTVTASTPDIITQATEGDERIGSFDTRYNLTTVSTRFSGEGFTASGDDLVREITLDPGETVTVKLQLGAIAGEIPESGPEYERYRDLDPETALRTQLAEYNQWWADNVPYIDVPDENIKKMSYYRTFLNRFNYFDANIPGNDFQFPVSVEGALGYNNAIQLTQPMHMQDLKYFRDPIYSYGNVISSGETSKCDAFIDNPGSHSWGNTYEQYIAREGWNAYKVHGGDDAFVRNFAHYAECDVEGQLAKYDSNDNFLIEYTAGFLTGNDADTPTFHWPQQQGLPVRQDRAEAAFQWSGALAAAEAYTLLGQDDKAAEMEQLADNIEQAVLTLLWDDAPADVDPDPRPEPATRITGQDGFGNAIRLNGPAPNQYVEMPEGILSGLDDVTIAAWVDWNGSQTWSRIFDFGSGTGTYMFLTPNAGGGANGLRLAITTSGGGGEQRVTSPEELPTGWQHVAVTLEGDTATIWLNGEQLASSDSVTLNPSDLGNTMRNWIGRSQFGADPLLNGAVDEFQIFDRALTQAEIASLVDSPAGTTGGGNVAWYRFDETDDLAVAVDSSGNGNDAAVSTPTVINRPGQVFKHRLTVNGDLIPWKDQQNFAPFIEGLVPTDDPTFREALRYYADPEEFPIMPFYTANQADKAESGFAGTNNFSNINATLQAQVFSQALRHYPSEYVTPDMYRRLLEWLTWVQYIGGDNRLPDNNEFFFNWNPNNQSVGRSGIHHNILGAYNFMLIDDIAGVRPRLDDVLELWPIDAGWDHFAINNLSYHGKDLTVVWDQPGVDHYGSGVPDGFSAYLDGQRLFTLDNLAHVTFDGQTAEVAVLDGSDTEVAFSVTSDPPTTKDQCRNDGWRIFYNPSFRNMGVCSAWVESGGRVQGGVIGPLLAANDISLQDNDRMVDILQKAGRDITPETGDAVNLAEGRPVEASFTATSPALRATAPEFAVDGWTISGLPANGPAGQAQAGYLAPNTIWGTEGSPNAEDWLEVDLGEPQEIDNIKLYFFNDKSYNPQQNDSSDTYRQPLAYRLQYHDGSDWVNIWGPRSSQRPLANFNEVAFPRVTTDRVRVIVTPQDGFGVGLKEIQVFNTGIDVEPLTAPQVFASATPTSGLEPLTVQFTGFAEDPQGGEVTVEWDFGDGQTSTELSPEHTYTEPGLYTATLTATDSDDETGTASVDLVVEEFDGNWAPFATATCSFTSPWENCQGINSGVDPPSSNPGTGVGWGTWPNGGTQWMQLDWDAPITTDRTEVFWYQDSPDGSNNGVKRPAEWVLQYWDDAVQDWVDVSNPSGYGTELNQYNVTTHDPVTTTAMRVTVETRADADATGALQWRVLEVAEEPAP